MMAKPDAGFFAIWKSLRCLSNADLFLRWIKARIFLSGFTILASISTLTSIRIGIASIGKILSWPIGPSVTSHLIVSSPDQGVKDMPIQPPKQQCHALSLAIESSRLRSRS